MTDALLPSGSAALYRRKMLDEIGLFDETFFLYCEDTDLGLRARWAGWECVYVPGAVVEHRYSHSAGRASPLKAYYVERNRLYTAIKNLPSGDAGSRAVDVAGAVFLARGADDPRTREGGGISAGGIFRCAAAVSGVARARVGAVSDAAGCCANGDGSAGRLD